MKDRFKFRVWFEPSYQEPEMIYEAEQTYDNRCENKGSFYHYNFSEILNDKHCKVMQCAGLKDKNGKLIYEGDIVKFKYENYGTPKQIIWDECHYILKDTFIILCDMEIKQFGLEVIGNIYNNPELLESEVTNDD